MTKKEKIENFIEKYNGYLITSLVCSEDISKTYIAKYIKEHGMEKVSRGVYIADDVWPDELFILQPKKWCDYLFRRNSTIFARFDR